MPRTTKPMNSPPAVILGDDPVNALGVARNLGRSGVRVYRVGATDQGILRSRYIKSTHIVPNLDDSQGTEFVHALKSVAREIGESSVLFPISDLHVLKVSRNAGHLERDFVLLTSSVSATETLVNKRRFYESLAHLGIPHPETRFPHSRDEFVQAARDIGYPVLLKPEISPLFAKRFRAKGFIAEDEKELVEHVDTLRNSETQVMIQEIVPGEASCMHGCAGFRAQTGATVFCYRRVREFPKGLGCGSLLVSVPSFVGQTRLLEYLAGIQYTGIFDAELKLDPRDGVFKLIEINARSWWQNAHPSISGLNLIEAAYDHATRGTFEGRDYHVNTKWIHLYNDLFAAREAGMGLYGWIRSLRGQRAFDIWACDDVFPMVCYVYGIALRKVSKILGFPRSEHR